MKKRLLEKLEWEKKFKMEIIKIKQEYPEIKKHKNEIEKSNKYNAYKRQKVSENNNDDSFNTTESRIDKEISQRNYHSKYVVCWWTNKIFNEELPNWIKTGDWYHWKGTLWKDWFNQCSIWESSGCQKWTLKWDTCRKTICLKWSWCNASTNLPN